MRVGKPTPEMIKAVNEFADAAELFLEGDKWTSIEAFEKYEDLDDDDPDKLEILRIKDEIAQNEFCNVESIDGRIVAYEYLKRKYAVRLKHMLLTAEVLMDNVCDPSVDYLDYRPSLFEQHVENEQ